MSKVLKSIGAFAGIAFLLLGILFGMQIMTFIFAQIGPTGSASISDLSGLALDSASNITNVTPLGYTVSEASRPGFTTGVLTNVTINASTSAYIEAPITNFTFVNGVVTNVSEIPLANATAYQDANITYTFTFYSDSRIASDGVTNNSLQSIISYTGQSSTQMTTVAIAITLAILIALFLLFWVFFIKGKGKGEAMGGGNFG